MDELVAVLAIAAGLGVAGTVTAAAYQVARHFGRLNREARARLAPPSADSGTVTRSELERMIRDAVRTDAAPDAPENPDAARTLGRTRERT